MPVLDRHLGDGDHERKCGGGVAGEGETIAQVQLAAVEQKRRRATDDQEQAEKHRQLEQRPGTGDERVQVRSLFNSGSIQVVGALPPFAEIRSVATAQGRFYNDEDNTEARNVAFLGSDTKKQLFSERDAVGQTVWMNGIPYTVIGVMKPKDQNSSYDGFDTRKVFIPFNSMRRDFPNKPPAVEHSVDRLLVAPWSLETHTDCVHQIRRTLGRLHNFDPRDEEAARRAHGFVHVQRTLILLAFDLEMIRRVHACVEVQARAASDLSPWLFFAGLLARNLDRLAQDLPDIQ